MRERARRSLKASSEGINQANKALLKLESKISLAVELEISRATLQKFFAGKPIERENFHKICERLKLPWEVIADLPPENESAQEELALESFDPDALVQEVRQKGRAYIQSRCGNMRVLDMPQPIGLNNIYTNVNILKKISSRQRLEITDLLQSYDAEKCDRPHLSRIVQDRVLGIEAVKKYPKQIVLGKPGAGKTTFLKYVALQCSNGQLQADLVPIFISLKDFAEIEHQPSLLEYITEQFSTYGITDPKIAKQLLIQGRMLVLLDGLDELKEIDHRRVLKSIRSCFSQFYFNHFIVTSRLAAREYTFEEFIEIEIADFDDSDIATFATKWFAAKDQIKSKIFIHKLKANSSIRELAINPLILTLLCLVFEELADFPSNRAELYKEAIEILLKKWDAKRNIEREQIYKQLSIQYKADLLSQIAFITFERGEYFFRQQELEQHIADYMQHLPGVNTDVSALRFDSAAVLKSIEAQHGLLVERARGIYSFSHLTFQEYFTAREIVASSKSQAFETALKRLFSHITEKRWREVLLLTAEMLRNADYMLQLMKQRIDNLLAQDRQLQAFLCWLSQKARSVSVCYKPAIVRAFYFDLALARILNLRGGTLDLARALDRNLTCELERTLALDLSIDRALALDQVVDLTLEPKRVFENVLKRVLTHASALEPKPEQLLQQLKKQLSQLDGDQRKFKQWWQANGQAWTEQLRSVIILERNIGHHWQFSKQQREALKQYYDANQLLIECLNRSYYVTRTVRAEIESTLLLPLAEIN